MKRIGLAVVMVVAAAFPRAAQVRAPNAAGVFAAHEHLTTTDLAASSAFWTAIGGEATQIGTMNGVRLPGIYILLQSARGGRGARAGGARGTAPAAQAGAPTPPAAPAPDAAASAAPPAPPEGTVGSVVDSVGIKVKNLRETLSKLNAVGVTPESGATSKSAAVLSPERVRVVLTEDPTLTTACASDELLMKVPNPAEAAAWYAKWFGASVSQDGADAIAHIPGMSLRFAATSAPVAGTRGRGLDHIGFDVKDLPALVSKMQDGGVTVNSPYRTINLGFLTGLAFVTDPWGTYIELNQGYDGH